jgi:hypothetical protein
MVVALQLSRAGVRLAAVPNKALGRQVAGELQHLTLPRSCGQQSAVRTIKGTARFLDYEYLRFSRDDCHVGSDSGVLSLLASAD